MLRVPRDWQAERPPAPQEDSAPERFAQVKEEPAQRAGDTEQST